MMSSERQAYRTGDFYAHAFVFHARMNEFLIDFGERRGWSLLANILRIRYSSAFSAFLDQPTCARLAAVIAFDDEMINASASVPPVRPGYGGRRRDQP